MNKSRIGALLGALLIVGALFAVPFAGAAFAVTEHCPDGWVTKDESGEDDNDIVLEAGTQFCVKGSTTASGILIADGETTLKEYLEGAGEDADVSHWVTYETTTTTTEETTTEETTTTTEETTTEETTTEETTTEETTTEETTTEETTTEETTTEETTSEETTPEGSVEELTPPSTDTIGQPASSSSVSTGLLLVLAGILAAVLVVVPAAARNRR